MNTRQDKRPQTIQLAVRVWLLLIGLEVLRHLVMVVTTAVNPTGVSEQILATMNPDQVRQLEEMGDAVLHAAVVGYYVIILLFALAILGVAAWMVMVVAKAKPKAASAVRLLTFFAIYFGLRAVFVFAAPSPMSQPNSVQFLMDGSLQIVVGVCAVVALVFLSRPDSRTWVAS